MDCQSNWNQERLSVIPGETVEFVISFASIVLYHLLPPLIYHTQIGRRFSCLYHTHVPRLTCVYVIQPLQASDKANASTIELNVIMARKSLHHNLIHNHSNNEEQRKTRKQQITVNNMDDETIHE